MAIESFIAKLGFDLSAFRRGIDSAKAHAKGFKTDLAKQTAGAVTSAVGGAFGVAAIGAAAKSVADYADSIKSLSENLGVSTDFLQAFEHGIKTSGGSTESAQASLQKFSDLVGEAAAGSLDAQGKLGQFGLSILDASGNLKTTEALLMEASDALKAIESPAERGAAAMDLFGKGGVKALSFLAQGSESMKAFVDQTDKLSVESIQALASAKSTIEGVFRSITIAVGTAISAVSKFFRILGAFSVTGSLSKAIQSVKDADASDVAANKPQSVKAGKNVFAEARKKDLEAEKKLGDEIQKNIDKVNEFAKRKAEAVRNFEAATRDLSMTREDRVKFTLEELANSRVQYSGRLGAEQAMARQAYQLEQWAERNRTMGYGDLAFQQLNRAGQIREGITNLTQSERFPFQSLTERVDVSNAELRKLTSMASTEGLLIRPTNGI